jgi:hypothetical protein
VYFNISCTIKIAKIIQHYPSEAWGTLASKINLSNFGGSTNLILHLMSILLEAEIIFLFEFLNF